MTPFREESDNATALAIRFTSGLRARRPFIAEQCSTLQSPDDQRALGSDRITTQFLIVVRTLGEFFRLRHVQGTNFSTAIAALYVGGALIAACSCWAGVTFYFFRRFMLSASITLATVPVLLVYKMAVIGW
jgi:hypothetical protein